MANPVEDYCRKNRKDGKFVGQIRAVHGPLLRNTTHLQIWFGIGIWKTATGMSKTNSNSNANLLVQLQTRIKMDKLLQINSLIQDRWIRIKVSVIGLIAVGLHKEAGMQNYKV